MAALRLFIFDVDGSFRDSSRALNEGLATGFISSGCSYPYSAKQAWTLRGIGKYNARINLVRALYAMELIKKDPEGVISSPNVEEKLDDFVESTLNDADRLRAEKICKISREFHNSRAAHRLVSVFPFASGAIDRLKSKNYEVAILTNSSMETVKRDLSELDLSKFSAIIAKESLKSKKPSGEGIKKIMSITGFSPKETIHVGDSVVDIRAAKDAGCYSAALLCGMGLKHHLEKEKPDHIFKNIWELSKHFEN